MNQKKIKYYVLYYMKKLFANLFSKFYSMEEFRFYA